MVGRRHLTEADLKARPQCWRAHKLLEGESLTGLVVRMPTLGAFNGTKIFLDTGTEIVALGATAKCGHTVLERELGRKQVKPGDRITVVNNGTHKTNDGRRRYRLEQVVV